jgi:hypothetical protein
VVPGLEVRLLEEVANRLHDLDGLGARRSLEREVGCEEHVRIAFTFVLDRSARRRRQRLDVASAAAGSTGGRTTATRFVVASATRSDQCKRRDE